MYNMTTKILNSAISLDWGLKPQIEACSDILNPGRLVLVTINKPKWCSKLQDLQMLQDWGALPSHDLVDHIWKHMLMMIICHLALLLEERMDYYP